MAKLYGEIPQRVDLALLNGLTPEVSTTKSDNFLVRPFSIQSVFALVNGGARGNTAKKISNTLHIPECEDEVKELFIGLTKTLQANDQNIFSTANKIYLAHYFKIHNDYKTTAVDVFKADIQNINFSKTEEAVDEINRWVEEQTHNKIRKLANPDAIGPNTITVLINALYFQGKWVTEFHEPSKDLFRLNKKDSVSTNMMSVYKQFNYYDNSDLKTKFIELPYKREQVSLTIVLPYEFEGLAELEERISDVFHSQSYFPTFVSLTIPKFKLESLTHLKPVLKNMGIKDAFSGAANFSGIGETQEGLVISEVVQKTFIEVDKKGTTIAAATMVVMELQSHRLDDWIKMVVDHPFIFYLKHKVNGILFVGRYVKAAEAV
ncbi:hypothetical protein ILUMI_12424 [Ignelater luminosus]|uniref:Serpin domain-containing protein n=1 Tax=Ignelater luminosus TaxID=2038154 RepID=A0A8K0CY70_IGNLU|nr:hypothetical protein ILUMI_12424 [Ignelater luminosus]